MASDSHEIMICPIAVLNVRARVFPGYSNRSASIQNEIAGSLIHGRSQNTL